MLYWLHSYTTKTLCFSAFIHPKNNHMLILNLCSSSSQPARKRHSTGRKKNSSGAFGAPCLILSGKPCATALVMSISAAIFKTGSAHERPQYIQRPDHPHPSALVRAHFIWIAVFEAFPAGFLFIAHCFQASSPPPIAVGKLKVQGVQLEVSGFAARFCWIPCMRVLLRKTLTG